MIVILMHPVQVLYLLNQLQNKSICESSEKQTQKDEDRERANDQELLHRLKLQEEELREQNQKLVEQNEQYKQVPRH